MAEIRLTIIVDNQAAPGFVAEHGFALWVESGDQRILFDTGQQLALFVNAAALDIDLDRATTLVLSHGHYDHTGGVAEILGRNPNLPIYLHAGVFQPRYSLDGGRAKIVKMPMTAMAALMHCDDARIHWLTGPRQLTADIGIAGPIPRLVQFENSGGPFFLDPEGRQEDIIQDDTALWLRGAKGLVVCLGCCHSGLLNTLRHIRAISGEERIDTIIGGLHLLNADQARLSQTIAALNEEPIGRIIACHCSGEAAIALLRQELRAEVVTGYAGLRLEVPAG